MHDSSTLYYNDEHRYSIIGGIDNKYKINNFYEYLLEYPDLNGYVRNNGKK